MLVELNITMISKYTQRQICLCILGMNIEIYHSSTLNTNPTLFLPNRNKYLWSKKLRLPTLSKNSLKCVLWGLETAQGKKISYCASVCIYSSTFPPSKGAAGVDPNSKSLESVAIKLSFRYLLTKFIIYIEKYYIYFDFL